MNLKDIFHHPQIDIFEVTADDYDNALNWTIEPTSHELIPAGEGHYIVRALEVAEDGISGCYLEFRTPERVSGMVVKADAKGFPFVGNSYQPGSTIIPAMACDFPGFYDVYAAKENPQAGIDVLRNGLEKAVNKSAVAEDLGYLLIDEERIDEAIEAFIISEKHTPTTRFTFFELAKLYARKGDLEKSNEYREKYLNMGTTDHAAGSPDI